MLNIIFAFPPQQANTRVPAARRPDVTALLASASVTRRYAPVDEIDLCPKYRRTFSIPAPALVCIALECRVRAGEPCAPVCRLPSNACA
jgi:hypothetical protein